MIMYYIYNMRKTILILIVCIFRACLGVMAQVDTSTVLPTGSTAFTPSFRWQDFGGKQLMWQYNSAKSKYYLTPTLQYTRANFANLSTNVFTGGQTSTGPGGIPSPLGVPGNVMFQDANFSAHLPASAYTAGRYPTYTFWIDGQDASGLYFRPISEGANLYGLWLLNINGTNDKVMLTRDMVNYVPTTRSITINGVTQDLSTNRTFTVATSGGSVTSVNRGLGFQNTGTAITTSGTLDIDTTTTAGVLGKSAANTRYAYLLSRVNATLTNGFGLTGSSYNGTTARTFAVDTTLLRTAANSYTLAQEQSKFNLKMNYTDTVTEAARYVKLATVQTITGLKTFNPTLTGATTGNTFSLNATATANNQSFTTLTINSPAVASGSFTGGSARALNVVGDGSFTNLTASSSVTANNLNGGSGVLTLQTNNGRFLFNSTSTNSAFIWGDITTAPNGSKLQIVGNQPGTLGMAAAMSTTTALIPALNNDKLIGLNLTPTYGTGTTAINSLPTPGYSGTATQNVTQGLVSVSGGTISAKVRVTTTTGATSFSSVTLVEGGIGYAAGNVITVSTAGLTATYTLVSGNIGLTGISTYSLALTDKVLLSPVALTPIPLPNTTEYDGTRLYQTTSAGVRSAIAYVSDGRTPIEVSSNATMVLNGDYLNKTATQYTLTLPATTGFTSDGSKIITALSTGTGGIIIRVPSGYSMQSGSSSATTTGTGGATLTQGTKVQLIPIGTNSFYLQPLNGSVTLY